MIPAEIIAYLVGLLTTIVIVGLFTLGLNLQFGFTGLINFGHAAFMAVGAYTMVILMVKAGWPLWIAMAAGVVLAAVFSLLIGGAALRLREDYLAITTIGFAEIVRLVITNEFWLTRGPQGMFGFPVPLEWLPLTPFGHRVVFMVYCTVLAGLVFWFSQRAAGSPWGRVLKGIREDEDAAIALGKNTKAFKLQSLALGSAMAGLSGVLMAFFLRYINPFQFVPLTTFEGWMIMVLGGAGNNWGVLLGSFLYFGLFTGTRQLETAGLAHLTGQQVAALRIVFIGVLLVLLMMYRPQGLLGRKEELTLEG